MFRPIKKSIKRLLKRYETFEKEDFLEETGGQEEEFRKERLWMELRNIFVFAAAILFLLSLILSGAHTLRAIAYFLGSAAYFFELVMLTEGFRKPIPRREAFMALCFGPLYVLMGLAYLF